MSITVDRDSFATFKHALREICPQLRSSHADEALAAALGFRTYAAFQSALVASEAGGVAEFDQPRLIARLHELNYAIEPDDVSALFRRHAEIMHDRIWENIRSLAIRPANDNG
ncbi:hypothetical protein [Devosia epidermidihirudinis]|uniref:hypothetical protein n=1 Tax=Devosia epidermidihirudinis TaxID=1293439 RepID=UPI00069860D4|nr:hypothetical protein [Devosia epidermidihirudinis]